jgi:type VI secretion system secreted protein Hcp
MPIYLMNKDVMGEVTATGHEGEIELTSLQFGAALGVSAPTGGGGKRTHSAASFSEIQVTKQLDNASGLILAKLAAGTALPSVHIFFTRASGKDKSGNDAYLTIELEDVLFSGWSLSSGGDMPTESVSLNYAIIRMNYMKSDAESNLTQGTITGWDLAKNVAA